MISSLLILVSHIHSSHKLHILHTLLHILHILYILHILHTLTIWHPVHILSLHILDPLHLIHIIIHRIIPIIFLIIIAIIIRILALETKPEVHYSLILIIHETPFLRNPENIVIIFIGNPLEKMDPYDLKKRLQSQQRITTGLMLNPFSQNFQFLSQSL